MTSDRAFRWCPQEGAEGCALTGDHVHICIGTPGTKKAWVPPCRKTTLRIFFHDLDPAAIRRSSAYEKGPDKGEELIAGCLTEEQAQQIAAFVQATAPDDVIVNCEAGISRSPGVVLALRRKYGGDTEEPFRKAHPNIHVASTLGRVLGVGPFQARKPEGLIVTDFFGDRT